MKCNSEVKFMGLLVLATIFWGMNGVFVRNINALSGLGITFGRLLIAGIPFLIFVLVSQKRRSELMQSLTNWKQYGILSFCMGMLFLCNSLAYMMTHIAVAQTLNSIGMFFTILLAPLLLGEHVSKKDIMGMLITFIGVVIVFGVDSQILNPEYLRGDILALMASMIAAFYGIFTRKFKISSPFYINMLWIFLGGSIWVLFGSIVAQEQLLIAELDTTSLLHVTAFAILSTTIAHTIFNMSFYEVRAEKVFTITLLGTVWAYGFGIVFLGEQLEINTLIGIGLTLIGIAAVIRSHKKVA